MKTTNKIPNCPPLRFPQFNDPWLRFRNEDIFTIITEKNKNLENLKVVSASLTHGVILREDLGIDIKYSEDSTKGYKIVRDGDYIIHLRSFQGGFAFSKLNGICSPAYTILRPQKEYLAYGFFDNFYRSDKFISSLKIVTYGIRDGKSISVEEWMKEMSYLPSLAEQERIAGFLSLIDERIEACSETIKELVNEKKALLSRLFDQSLRFPQFSDPWQPTTLGEVLSFETGYPFPSDRFNEEGYGMRLIKNRDLKADDRLVFYNGTYEKQYIVQNKDILIGMDGDFSPCLWKKGIALLNQRVGRVNIKKGTSKVFIFYLLGDYLKGIELKTASTTVKHLSHKDVESIKASLPSLAEQERIANFLSLIDERIELEEALLRQYELQKRYLLQQMFV